MTRTFSTGAFLILCAIMPALGPMGAQNGEWLGRASPELIAFKLPE